MHLEVVALAHEILHALNCGPWSVLWNHMPAEYDFIVRQTSLLMTRTRGADSIDKEAIRSNWGLETLRSTPSHVLNRNPGTLGDVIEVSKTMNDDSPAALLNDTRQDTQRRRARVLAQEYIVRRTLLPGNVRCVNSRLYIRPIKVEGVSLLIEERAGEAEDIPEDGVYIEDAVHVKGGIDD